MVAAAPLRLQAVRRPTGAWQGARGVGRCAVATVMAAFWFIRRDPRASAAMHGDVAADGPRAVPGDRGTARGRTEARACCMGEVVHGADAHGH